jgi:hypothetical protein
MISAVFEPKRRFPLRQGCVLSLSAIYVLPLYFEAKPENVGHVADLTIDNPRNLEAKRLIEEKE